MIAFRSEFIDHISQILVLGNRDLSEKPDVEIPKNGKF